MPDTPLPYHHINVHNSTHKDEQRGYVLRGMQDWGDDRAMRPRMHVLCSARHSNDQI